MRQADEGPHDPERTAMLEAIDATLAGDPVEPAFAEFAELALLVAAERPEPAQGFVRALDRRVEGRFARPATESQAVPARRPIARRWRWALAPAVGAAALVAVIVIALSSGGGGGLSASSSAVSGRPPSGASRPFRLNAPSSSSPTGQHAAVAPHTPLQTNAAGGSGTTPAYRGLRPPAKAQKLVQSSQLGLGAPVKRIEQVAQEVFNVIGAQQGFVDSSTVNAGASGGYAHFQLTVPSSQLSRTMALLSTLPHAVVLSRTDSVQNVTGQLRSALRSHQKARAQALERSVAYSQIIATIRPDAAPADKRSHNEGFTIANAARIALHVLTVIGGVALVALAVLIPLAIVVALGWWIAATLRRHRRERALDLA